MVFIDTLVGGFNLSVEYKRWSAKSFFRNCWTKLTSKLLALGLLTDINCGNVDNLQKQLRRIYDSTLDRRPLSGKVFWRKILELKKKNWRKVVANESKTEVWKGGKYVWEFWVFAVVVRLNLLRLVGSSQFWPSHLVTVLPYSCFILNFLKFLHLLFNDGKWCAFFVEQKQSHFIKLNDTTTVFDVVGMHDRDK